MGVYSSQPGPEGMDTYVYSLDPASNFGNNVQLNGLGLPYSEAYIEFDLSSIPSNASILSADFNLYSEVGGSGTITIDRITSAWTELGVTWNNKPSASTPSYTYPIDRGAPAGPCYWRCIRTFSIIDIIQYIVSHPGQNYGIRLTANTGSGWLSFSSDNANVADRPKLDITYATYDY
jgi:hypothetical protein